jgi:hypothetical protein
LKPRHTRSRGHNDRSFSLIVTIERANRTRNAFYNETEVENVVNKELYRYMRRKKRFENKQSRVRRIRKSFCGLHRSSTEKSVPWLWITCNTVMCRDESSCREIKRVRNVPDEDVRGFSNARLCMRRALDGNRSPSVSVHPTITLRSGTWGSRSRNRPKL